ERWRNNNIVPTIKTAAIERRIHTTALRVLVVWVNAISAKGGTNVDCQSIRMEFVDKNGDLFAQDTSSWFGGTDFWRAGHVFSCYPRDERELTLRVTTWRGAKTTNAMVLNPHVTLPSQFSGGPL